MGILSGLWDAFDPDGKSVWGFGRNVGENVGAIAGGLGQLASVAANDLTTLAQHGLEGDYVTDDVVKALPSAIAGDYRDRYAEGDIGQEFYDRPLDFGLDALGVYAAAKGAGVAGRAVTAAEKAAAQRFPNVAAKAADMNLLTPEAAAAVTTGGAEGLSGLASSIIIPFGKKRKMKEIGWDPEPDISRPGDHFSYDDDIARHVVDAVTGEPIEDITAYRWMPTTEKGGVRVAADLGVDHLSEPENLEFAFEMPHLRMAGFGKDPIHRGIPNPDARTFITRGYGNTLASPGDVHRWMVEQGLLPDEFITNLARHKSGPNARGYMDNFGEGDIFDTLIGRAGDPQDLARAQKVYTVNQRMLQELGWDNPDSLVPVFIGTSRSSSNTKYPVSWGTLDPRVAKSFTKNGQRYDMPGELHTVHVPRSHIIGFGAGSEAEVFFLNPPNFKELTNLARNNRKDYKRFIELRKRVEDLYANVSAGAFPTQEQVREGARQIYHMAEDKPGYGSQFPEIENFLEPSDPIDILRNEAEMQNLGQPIPAPPLQSEPVTTGFIEDAPLTDNPFYGQFVDILNPDPQLQKVQGPSIGGAGDKAFYADPEGNKYIFKIARTKYDKSPFPAKAHAEELGSKLQAIAHGEEPAVRATVMDLDGEKGALLPFVEDAQDLRKLFGNNANAVRNMTPEQIAHIQREQVVDWLLSQHDSHSGQVLMMPDGKLQFIDKEQAYRFFGDPDEAELDWRYHPNQVEEQPIYNDLIDAYIAGDVSMTSQPYYDAIQRLQEMPEDEFIEMLKPYALARGMDIDTPLGPGHKFLADAFNRRNSLQQDFVNLIERIKEAKSEVSGIYGEMPQFEDIFDPATGALIRTEVPNTGPQLDPPNIGPKDLTQTDPGKKWAEEQFAVHLDQMPEAHLQAMKYLDGAGIPKRHAMTLLRQKFPSMSPATLEFFFDEVRKGKM